MKRRRIVILGPLPPPIHGAAKNTRIISTLLSEAGADVIQLRNNPVSKQLKSSTLWHYFKKILTGTIICIRLFFVRVCGPYDLYSVPDGGFGLYINLVQYAIARLCGAKITLHHRNYSHIAVPSLIMQILTKRVCTKARHVFLSNSMASEFKSVYPAVREALVVSNAAMLDFNPVPVSNRSSLDLLTVGYFSNLTEEKGFDVVADVMRDLRQRSDRYRFVIGGSPVNEREQQRLERLIADLGDMLEYQGSLYGKDKERFFAKCDVFLFPTRYRKEAQPNVLFEALAAGCIVLSTRRACIPELLAGYEAEVFEEEEALASTIAQAVELLPLGPSLIAKREHNVARIRLEHDRALEALRQFIHSLAQ